MRQQHQVEKVTKHRIKEAIQSREEYLTQQNFLAVQNTALEMTQYLCQFSMSSASTLLTSLMWTSVQVWFSTFAHWCCLWILHITPHGSTWRHKTTKSWASIYETQNHGFPFMKLIYPLIFPSISTEGMLRNQKECTDLHINVGH